jgi:hypothetical protein
MSAWGPAGSVREPYREPVRDIDGATPDGQPRPHRPALFADLTEMIDAAGADWSATSRSDVAAATAAVVVRAGRSPGDDERFVGLADRVGLDTLAALWQDADPVSLPGALWALYLLRQWCQLAGEDVTRLWRLGVADYADVAAVRDLADAVLTGVYRGDLAVALERAAAFFRVVAAGRRSVDSAAHDGGAEPSEPSEPAQRTERSEPSEPSPTDLALRNERAAAALAAAAARWRAGTLH